MRWPKRASVPRRGPRSATSRGSQGWRMKTSSCRPIRLTSGPLSAPATPGMGRKAGRVAMNSSMPNRLPPRPSIIERRVTTSSGGPTESMASSARALAYGGAGRALSAIAQRFDVQPLQQQLVDTRAVQVHHLDPPPVPFEVLAHHGDAAEVGDDHARGGVVIAVVAIGQRAPVEE